MKKPLTTLFLTLYFGVAMATGVFNVRDYGAKGDGKTLDSPAINAAIEAAVRDGGGQVLLPAGTYLSGSIRMKSNIDLHLSAGCTILAAPASMKAYDEPELWEGPQYQDGGHTFFHNSLIWAEGAQNVSITGRGTIDGQGLTKKDKEKGGNVQGGSIGTGDKAIALKLCRNITISNCTCMWSSGLAFEEVDQGRMENICVTNIAMDHVHHYPIYITTGCRNRGPKEVTQPSSARNIQISNIIATDCDSLCSIIVTGMKDEPIRNVWLSNIRLTFRGGGTKDLADKNYREQGTNYPEPRWAGPTPAYGLYARHVEGLHVNDVTFRYERPEYRPAIMLDDVRDATLNQIDAPTEPGVEQTVRVFIPIEK